MKADKSRLFYAKEWPCGLAITEVRNGYGKNPITRNVVNVYAFASSAKRDQWVDNWQAPNHTPSAFAEAVSAKDEDVRRIRRDQFDDFNYAEEQGYDA